MTDARPLYINQILNHYYKSFFEDNESYCVNYRLSGAKEDCVRMLSHNEGLDVVRDYIKDLEAKVEELRYVERIIRIAKEN